MAGIKPQQTGRALYRWILFAVTLAAVAWFVWKNAGRLSGYASRIDPAATALCLLAVSAGYLARFAAWTRLASLFGLRAPVRKAGRAYFLSILGRYIPGKLGLALIRIEAYRPHPPERVALATGTELVTALSAALMLMLAGIASAPSSFPFWLRLAAPAGMVATLAVLSPPVLHRAAGLVFRLTGRERPEKLPGFARMFGLTALYIFPGLLQGLGLYALLLSLGPVQPGSYLAVTGAYYAAGLAGMLAVFAPGGLGVREGILMLVLPLIVPKESAIVAALLLRLIMMGAELLLAGIWSALAPRGGR
jgi:uncharacterized membrane protein YbhN (UPF0104 family)